MGDCIIFSNLSYLLLTEYNNLYGNEFKYLSIKEDNWSKEDNNFHKFITFKYNNVWYYLDRFECSIYNNKKKDKKIGLTEWKPLELVMYRSKCGYKTEIEAQTNIFTVVNKHLLSLTGKHYLLE
tara:strand:+ start:3328 stop:3699 length:372 start_codon:yes stop_codon:yes gene_type:complete